MKKISYFVAIAATVLSLSACGNKQQADAAEELGDTVTVELADEAAEAVAAEAEPVIAALKEKIEANDADGVAKIIEQVKEQIAKLDPAQASAYVKQVQGFINENKDKIETLTESNATVKQIVSTLTTLDAEEAAKAVVNAAKSKVEDAVQQKVEEGKAELKAKANEKVEESKAELKAKANEAISNAANKLMGK